MYRLTLNIHTREAFITILKYHIIYFHVSTGQDAIGHLRSHIVETSYKHEMRLKLLTYKMLKLTTLTTLQVKNILCVQVLQNFTYTLTLKIVD